MTERGQILVGISGGMIAALALITLGPVLNLLPFQSPTLVGRAPTWAVGTSIALTWLAIAVGRLAKHRFLNPSDLDPMRDDQTALARSLTQQLQNTLEQTVLAIGAYAVWTALSPSSWGVMPILGAILFSLGRLLFFMGYSNGASRRALGFALTFYPTLAILGCSLLALVIREPV